MHRPSFQHKFTSNRPTYNAVKLQKEKHSLSERALSAGRAAEYFSHSVFAQQLRTFSLLPLCPSTRSPLTTQLVKIPSSSSSSFQYRFILCKFFTGVGAEAQDLFPITHHLFFVYKSERITRQFSLHYYVG